MPTTTPPHAQSCLYHPIFPSWEDSRPVGWFFAEQLLEVRAISDFPTNAAGPDEDVNVYLVALLGDWALDDGRRGVEPGRDPLLTPPGGGSRWQRAARYRRQADHRMLALGLFDRGDLVRRRRRGWRMTEDETRARDLAVAVRSYGAAADLLDGRDPAWSAAVSVWRKLARHAPRYVHVLQTLGRRRLGFGARLGEGTLERLLAGTE